MVSEKDLGSSLLFFALFVALLWVATERASYLVVGAVLFGGGVAVRAQPSSTTCRTASRSGSTRGRTRRTTATRSSSRSSRSRPAASSGTGLNLGSPTRIPYAETDFIFAAIGEELGLVGATGVLIAFLLMIGAGPAHRAAHDRAVRAIAGDGAHRAARRAVVHHHRGGDPRPAPDRRHAAVRVLRRVVAHRQLRAPRPPAAHLRRHRPTGRRAR